MSAILQEEVVSTMMAIDPNSRSFVNSLEAAISTRCKKQVSVTRHGTRQDELMSIEFHLGRNGSREAFPFRVQLLGRGCTAVQMQIFRAADETLERGQWSKPIVARSLSDLAEKLVQEMAIR